MRMPQLLIHESDGRLAAQLKVLVQVQRWVVREAHGLPACLAALQRGGPAVLVIKLGQDLERELDLLEQVAWHHPDTGRVVVSDSDHPRLAGLAWDLGADAVLFTPAARERLAEVVAGLMGVRQEPDGGPSG